VCGSIPAWNEHRCESHEAQRLRAFGVEQLDMVQEHQRDAEGAAHRRSCRHAIDESNLLLPISVCTADSRSCHMHSASEAGHVWLPVRRADSACASRDSVKTTHTCCGGDVMPDTQVTWRLHGRQASCRVAQREVLLHHADGGKVHLHVAAMRNRVRRTSLGCIHEGCT